MRIYRVRNYNSWPLLPFILGSKNVIAETYLVFEFFSVMSEFVTHVKQPCLAIIFVLSAILFDYYFQFTFIFIVLLLFFCSFYLN
jgi:hypothetical protein